MGGDEDEGWDDEWWMTIDDWWASPAMGPGTKSTSLHIQGLPCKLPKLRI